MNKPVLLHLYYLDPLKQQQVTTLMQSNGFEVFFCQQNIAAAHVDVLLVGAHELTAQTLSAYTRLQMIQVLGNNTCLIDLDYCQSNNIKVLLSKEPRGHLIAEHALSLALALIRRLPEADHAVRNWQQNHQYPVVTATETTGYDNWPAIKPQSLFSSTVGILGAGAIGLELIKRLTPFACSINYNKQSRYSDEVEKKLSINFQTIEQLLTTSDILFIQLPLNKATQSLINQENIDMLKPGVIIINCGRAAVIEEKAFMQALAQQKIAYAGLDVFWQEPLPQNHALCQNDNVILTPHMAEIGGRDVSLLRKEALEQIIAFFD